MSGEQLELFRKIWILNDLGLKNKAKDEELSLIKKLHEISEGELEKIVYEICETLFNPDEIHATSFIVEQKFRISHRIFKEIIFPVLLKGAKKANSDSFLYIAFFNQLILKDKSIQKTIKTDLGIIEFDALEILKKGYEINANNSNIYKFIINQMLYELSYYTHELKSGVLLDSNIFKNKINEFVGILEKEDRLKYSEIITHYLNISEKWEKYTSEHDFIGSFEDFVKNPD